MKQALQSIYILFRKLVNISLFTFDTVLRRKNNIVVLCYHSIENDSWRFSISPAMLKKQISLLKHAGYQFISLDDLVGFLTKNKQIPTRSVVITIDDGYKNVNSIVSFFEKERITPGLFVLSSPDKANRSELANTKQFLAKQEVQTLMKKGWIIGSHSKTHANLTTLSQESLHEEVVTSKKELEKLGKPVSYFAYPRGKYTRAIERMVEKAGFCGILTMDDGVISPKTNPFRIPRVGVDQTHGLVEFQTLFSPSVIAFRNMLKHTVIGRNL